MINAQLLIDLLRGKKKITLVDNKNKIQLAKVA